MCPPRYFTVRDVKNPFMKGAAVDRALAQKQWAALREALEDAGVSTTIIDPVPDLEDMVFAANQTFVGRRRDGESFVVSSRMRFASREREVPYYRAWFAERNFRHVDVDLRGEYLEGHGDLLWHPARRVVWAGYGFRSSLGGVERLAEALVTEGIEVRPLALVDERFYHLDTCFSPLNEDAAILFPAAFSDEALQRLRAQWKRLYEIDESEALHFVCNGIVARNHFVASYIPLRLDAALAREGLQSVIVDLSEFEKSGGSAFCLKTFVD